ncbi:MAG: glucose-1-phosphate adenylyltransferase [Clostridia bacterium]|nr:glucose-1-phosphate adenylyltransferase [Clostridia bacterium]
MYPKQECIAMLLAGGQGSRLYALTKRIAKPAVPFGGKYRIIDFPLSNCVNSGIDTVGVLTQYQPLVLNDYLGNGQPWDLDTMYGGVHALPPYQGTHGADWYKGTANAIYQNIPFIERYNPDYVVILSGDHIYKMDYSEMLAYHKSHKAACTIAAYQVPMEEASRFGILNCHEDGSIYEFDEKPKVPKSNNASMGIYIFSWDKLRKYLEMDEANPNSSNDFGKDVLPAMLNAGEKMVAWKFEGYWKDVGTIDSLWEANMDLLDPNDPLEMSDPSWRIFTRNPVMPPHYVGKNADCQNSLVTEGCMVNGKLEFSILFEGVQVETGAKVTESIIMPGAKIMEGAVVQFAIVAENAVIGPGAVVGERPEQMENRDDWGIAVIGGGVKVGANAVVKAKAMVEEDIPEVTK